MRTVAVAESTMPLNPFTLTASLQLGFAENKFEKMCAFKFNLGQSSSKYVERSGLGSLHVPRACFRLCQQKLACVVKNTVFQ